MRISHASLHEVQIELHAHLVRANTPCAPHSHAHTHAHTHTHTHTHTPVFLGSGSPPPPPPHLAPWLGPPPPQRPRKRPRTVAHMEAGWVGGLTLVGVLCVDCLGSSQGSFAPPATTPPPLAAHSYFLLGYEGFLIGVGSMNERWFYGDVQGPMGDATSAVEAQACRSWAVTIRAKILPGTVAKGTLDRCTVQEIHRKFTCDCVAIMPALQSAHIIATISDVHQVSRTLGVVQLQPVVPPTVHATTPRSRSSGSTSQIVRLGDNVQELQMFR